jgi:hypothetical protein
LRLRFPGGQRQYDHHPESSTNTLMHRQPPSRAAFDHPSCVATLGLTDSVPRRVAGRMGRLLSLNRRISAIIQDSSPAVHQDLPTKRGMFGVMGTREKWK